MFIFNKRFIMIGSNKKNIFLLFSIFISGQNVIASERYPDSSSGGSTTTNTMLTASLGATIVTNLINFAITRWYFKSPTISSEPINNGSKTSLSDIQYEPVDRLNQKISALMSKVYEHNGNTITDFERVQKLKQEAVTKELSPAALTLIKETLERDSTLKTYGNALEHLNALACNLQTEYEPKKPANQVHTTLSTKDKIIALKNNMYSNINQDDSEAYKKTLELIKTKQRNEYSEKILETLFECLTSGNNDNSDLTLTRYNTCEHAAQVQAKATNSTSEYPTQVQAKATNS